MKSPHLVLTLAFLVGVGLSSIVHADQPDDLTVTLSEDAVNRFAQAATPLTVRGTQEFSVTAPVVGTIGTRVPWVAVVTKPRIKIEKEAASFESAVTITASGTTYTDKLTGTLDPSYDRKTHQIRVTIKDALLRLRVPGGGDNAVVKINITDQLPVWDLPVMLPSPELRIGEKRIQVEMNPRIKFELGQIVVTSALRFQPVGPAGKNNSKRRQK